MLTGDELGQVLPLLRLAAVAAELVDAKIGMGAVRQADGARGARHFLHGHAMLEIAEAGAAILFLDRDAVQAEGAELRPQIARELVAAVDRVGARRDLGLREVAHRVADGVGVLAEIEVEIAGGVGEHGALPSR